MAFNKKPLIGIILDEDTTKGGKFYQTGKGYFAAIDAAGGVAIGLPYSKNSIDFALENCDGLLSTGAKIKFPKKYYIEGEDSTSDYSDRFDIDEALIKEFVKLDKPFLGICNGMQLLGCVMGSKMTYRLHHHNNEAILHNSRETRHKIQINPDSHLFQIMGEEEIIVNSHHDEALMEFGPDVIVTSRTDDNIVEAIEIKDKKFAIGVQWHPELLWPKFDEADSNISIYSQKLFQAFLNACIN